MYQYLIIDGYNVINAWPELKKLKDENLEHARNKLVEMLASYRGYKGVEVTVVFDAQYVKDHREHYEFIDGVEVIFTCEGETADTVIERLTCTRRNLLGRIGVVTSDWAEQLFVLGQGAFRIPARELLEEVTLMQKELKEKYARSTPNQDRQTVDSRIEETVRKILEKWRKGERD